MMQPIAVAMSGGVDSTMAAYLIKNRGLPVIGIHFITGYEDHIPNGLNGVNGHRLQRKTDLITEAARKRMSPVSEHLGIPLETIDIQNEFENSVVKYFADTYRNGKTPNPCMVCNPKIKFGTLRKIAKKLGAARLATGHYAKIVTEESGIRHLFRGKDPLKEQSYFLARLSQEQLASAEFPLGDMTKAEVIQMAESIGIISHIKEESQDICFINNRTYGEFLKDRFGMSKTSGHIVDTNGNVLGEHNGLHLFTIGQRRGINCPAAEPYYVVRIDPERNRLIVGRKQDILTSTCRVEDINWIAEPPKSAISVKTRVRYRHREAPSKLIPVNEREAVVEFDDPQEAVTPGQCAVFYLGDEVMGGGWIQTPE